MLNTKWDPGRMDARVTIHAYTVVEDTVYGGEAGRTRTDVRSVWAKVESSSAKQPEKYTDEMVQTGRHRILVTMRYWDDVDTLNTITWDGLEYDVLGVTMVGRKQGIVLDCLAHEN